MNCSAGSRVAEPDGPADLPATTIRAAGNSAVANPADAPGARVARNVLSMIGARAVVAVAGLICIPVVFTDLGDADFGVWVLLSGLVTLVALVDLGMGSAIVRAVAMSRHDRVSARG